MSIFDLKDLPENCLERQAKIFLFSVEERAKQTLGYIQTEFKQKEILYECVNFINLIFLDGFKSYVNILSKIGFFPSNETQIALQDSLNYAFIGAYRAAYDHLRRGLEMMCLTVYFSLDDVDKVEALNWMRSKSKSPYISTVLTRICQFSSRFNNFNEKFNWKYNLKQFYGNICDIIHVNGLTKGYHSLGLTHGAISGVHVPRISNETLDNFLEHYIKAIQEVCIILALYNPILLVSIPIDEKYGFNGPISGFFQYKQPELFKKLIPICYQAYFDKLVQNDSEVLSQVEFFNSLPDITDEELARQAKKFEYDENI